MLWSERGACDGRRRTVAWDLREGSRRGRVMSWWAEDGYLETDWAGTTDMLAETADRLDEPTRTEIVEGGVRWR